MNFKFEPFLAATTLLIALATAGGARGATDSPFADKPCQSYASYNDAKGQHVNPLWGSLAADDFGPRTITFDQTGVRDVRQVPPAGVHPRICFTPDDLPEIRQRLIETRAGQEAWKNLLSWTNMMKGDYDDSADYAKPDKFNGGYSGLHARVPLWRLGIPRETGFTWNHCKPAAEIYESLVDGSAQSCPTAYWNVMALEAFRCLVKEDHSAAQRLAKATITAMKLAQAQRAAAREAKHITTPPDEPLFDVHTGFQLAFIYDFINNDMNSQQREAVHAELADTTWSHDNYGTFNAATASRSNWATFSYWLFEVLSIEGEPGFNDLKVRGMYRGWRNLLTYGWFQSGATFEGEAKNQLGMDGVIMFAMRAKQYGFTNLCGHSYLRAFATQFLPKSVIPTQDGFVKYDLLGGVHSTLFPPDAIGLKYMFPQDKTIDWVYRKSIGENYENMPDRCDGYINALLFAAIYATDFDPANDDAGKLGLSNTFFCPERALLMTRSDWKSHDAVMLNMHTREANGGHPFADRNAIMLAGAGRVWSPTSYATFKTQENSVVCIDGQSQTVNAPGKMLDFQDTPKMTYATGDASYAWDWSWQSIENRKGIYSLADVRGGKVLIPAGWEPETHSINDFSMLRLPLDYLNAPRFEAPHWLHVAGAIEPVVRKPLFPVQRAIRTAALIRGSHPYALIVDDIQKDDSVHHYDWTLVLERDIQIVSMTKTSDREFDLLLSGDDPQQQKTYGKGVEDLPGADLHAVLSDKQPMLLVRVLNRSSAKTSGDPYIEMMPNQTSAEKYPPTRHLVIPCDSVSPQFKVLLFPYRQGARLPDTAWNADRTKLEVNWPDQHDSIRWSTGPNNRTLFQIE